MFVEPAQAAMTTNINIHTYHYLQISTNIYIYISLHTNRSPNWMSVEPAQSAITQI